MPEFLVMAYAMFGTPTQSNPLLGYQIAQAYAWYEYSVAIQIIGTDLDNAVASKRFFLGSPIERQCNRDVQDLQQTLQRIEATKPRLTDHALHIYNTVMRQLSNGNWR